MKRYGAKTDENQQEIIEALEAAGCRVFDGSGIGAGFPDLIVGKHGRTFLIEVKNPNARGKLNKRQRQFFAEWDGHAAVAYTVEEALRIIGAID